MEYFPPEFVDLLTTRGRRLLNGVARPSFASPNTRFVNLQSVIRRDRAENCMRLLDDNLYESLHVEQSGIPPESITEMKYNYTETLPKTMHFKTAFFRKKTARSYQAADKIGLLKMMRSESFVRFAEAISGLALDREYSIQATCYEHGDYAGPHNDHHPEAYYLKDGFVDFHIMFTNKAVQHQYLIYEHRGHFSRIVDINVQGAVSVYRLPFWHYTTPLTGKVGREAEARRWLLLATFPIRGVRDEEPCHSA